VIFDIPVFNESLWRAALAFKSYADETTVTCRDHSGGTKAAHSHTRNQRKDLRHIGQVNLA